MDTLGIKEPLWFVGVVENVYDPIQEGRVQVRAFGIHGLNTEVPRESLPWAVCVKGDYNGSGGALPEVNDFVLGMFIDGREAQQPVIMGTIPTKYGREINPERHGWGVVDEENLDAVAPSTRPENWGQPQISRLARGENIEETYVLDQEMGRITEIRSATGQGQEAKTWEEPPSAYDAQYPHNRVIETPGGSIELDSTPRSERIMIRHKSGSYIQIDSNGVTTIKSEDDKYEINAQGKNVYVGGKCNVTIMGDSYVYVDGNKVEEVNGDYQQIVHGNHLLSVGGQSNIIASEQVQIRGADIKFDANVGTFSYYAEKEIQFQSGIGLYLKAPLMWIEGNSVNFKSNDFMNLTTVNQLNVRSNDRVNIHSKGDMNMFSEALFNIETTKEMHILADKLYATGTNDGNLSAKALKVSATDGKLSLTASGEDANIAADASGIITLANSASTAATVANESAVGDPEADNDEEKRNAPFADAAIDAVRVEAPEPATKSTATVSETRNRAPRGGGGYASADDRVESSGGGSGDPLASVDPSPQGASGTQADREREAMQFFTSNGYTDAQAAGIVGNLINESNLIHTLVNPGDGNCTSTPHVQDSVGIAQWNCDRRTAMEAFTNEIGKSLQPVRRNNLVPDFETQLKFIIRELNTTESGAASRLRSATNATQAAVAFSYYERFAGYREELNGPETRERAADAERIFNDWKQREAPV